jgi:hypothetical protein
MGLRWEIPPRHLCESKAQTIPLIWSPCGQEYCRWEFYRIYFMTSTPTWYWSRYFTPCCGLQMPNPTHCHWWVIGRSNTFDLAVGNITGNIHRVHTKITKYTFKLNPKCARNVTLQILLEIFIEPFSNIEVEILHPVVRIPPRYLYYLKGKAIYFT